MTPVEAPPGFALSQSKMGDHTSQSETPASPRRSGVRYPNEYVWLVFVAAMDIMLTWLVLSLGGAEVNPIANLVLVLGGFPAMVLFKFAAIVLVVLICEFIGARQERTGRNLARAAVGISAIPIVLAMMQLFMAFVIA